MPISWIKKNIIKAGDVPAHRVARSFHNGKWRYSYQLMNKLKLYCHCLTVYFVLCQHFWPNFRHFWDVDWMEICAETWQPCLQNQNNSCISGSPLNLEQMTSQIYYKSAPQHTYGNVYILNAMVNYHLRYFLYWLFCCLLLMINILAYNMEDCWSRFVLYCSFVVWVWHLYQY